MFRSKLFYFLLWNANVFFANICFSQKLISVSDSTTIYQLLEQAKLKTDNSEFDNAIVLCESAISFSQYHNLKKEAALSYIQLTDNLYQKGQIDEISKYDSLVLKIGIALNDSFIIANAYNQFGKYFIEKYEDEKAENAFLFALKFSNKFKELSGEIYNNRGYLFGLAGDNEKAIENYMQAMRIYDAVGNKLSQAQTFSNLAVLMNTIGDNEKAIFYQKQCIAIRDVTTDFKGLALAYLNLTNIYIQMDSLDAAQKYLQLGLKNAEAANSKKIIAQSYLNIGAVKFLQKDYNGALEAELENIRILEELNDLNSAGRRYIAAGAYAYHLKDSALELKYYQKAIKLSKQINNKVNIKDAYSYLALYYKNVKQDYAKAYESLKLFYLYRDSLSAEETMSNIAEIQTKYETEKKDNEILKLYSEKRIQELEIEKQKAISTGNILLAKQKQTEIDLLKQEQELQALKLKQKQEEIVKKENVMQLNEQKLQISEQQKLISEKQLQKEAVIRSSLIALFIIASIFGVVLFNRFQLKKQLQQKEALLEERSRISSDLHDDIGSALSGISIYSELGKMKTAGNIELQNILDTIADNTKSTQQNMQDIIWSLNPYNDNFEQLITRMKLFAAEILEPKNITLQFQTDTSLHAIEFHSEKRKDFFLLFKEAINNCAKYSECRNVTVELKKQNEFVSLKMKDNGKGFNMQTVKKGNGLNTMYERAKSMEAKIIIQSESGQGTSIELEFDPT